MGGYCYGFPFKTFPRFCKFQLSTIAIIFIVYFVSSDMSSCGCCLGLTSHMTLHTSYHIVVTDVPHQEDPVQDDKVKEVLKNEESECGTAPEKEDKDQLGDSENKSGGATGKGKLSKSVSISEEPEFTKSGSLSKQKKRSTKRKKSTSASDDKDDRPEIRPRTKSSSYDPRVGVELALGKGRLQDLPPKTVWQVFKETVTRIPDNTAMRYKESSDGEWQSMSYSEYHDQVIQAAKSFLKVRCGVSMVTGSNH